ncbi:hypothetical protein H0H81_008760 [Sphagnurus paluster]|uniref:Uncharacterized protein n=1 Tax=Sphagnurus paluster TaxID=117069 RepID=A0A9P7GQY3_9AGAR|nr:hypothetical protein H0H81_008760 [Sphagnurus paluster]
MYTRSIPLGETTAALNDEFAAEMLRCGCSMHRNWNCPHTRPLVSTSSIRVKARNTIGLTTWTYGPVGNSVPKKVPLEGEADPRWLLHDVELLTPLWRARVEERRASKERLLAQKSSQALMEELYDFDHIVMRGIHILDRCGPDSHVLLAGWTTTSLPTTAGSVT